MKAKAKDILIRAAKTFVQAFVTYLSADIFFGITDLDTLKKVVMSALIGAATAGVCAVMNLFIAWADTYFNTIGKISNTYSEDEADGEEYDTEGDNNGE
jgi:hypothetical protein